MRQILIVAGLTLFAMSSVAKEHARRSDSSKETGTAPLKSGTIKDHEAVRCILDRLVQATGIKEWKIELKQLAGTARNFVATSGARQESGTVNVAKSYPNQGALRVYLVPKD